MRVWTPKTAQVKDAYVRKMRDAFVASTSEHEAEFERWLEAERHKWFQKGIQAQWEHRPLGNRLPLKDEQ